VRPPATGAQILKPKPGGILLIATFFAMLGLPFTCLGGIGAFLFASGLDRSKGGFDMMAFWYGFGWLTAFGTLVYFVMWANRKK